MDGYATSEKIDFVFMGITWNNSHVTRLDRKGEYIEHHKEVFSPQVSPVWSFPRSRHKDGNRIPTDFVTKFNTS